MKLLPKNGSNQIEDEPTRVNKSVCMALGKGDTVCIRVLNKVSSENTICWYEPAWLQNKSLEQESRRED